MRKISLISQVTRGLAAVLFTTLILSVPAFAQTQAQTWIELAPSGTPPQPVFVPKNIHYDAANNRLIAFYPGNPPFNGNPPGNGNEVWILTNANGLGGTPAWSKLLPSGSPPFSNGNETAVYDAATNHLIVYGGCFANCSPALSNVFVLSNANGLGGPPVWSQSNVTNPQARAGHSAVADSATNLMITFGGHLAFFGTDHNDTRILANANGTASPSTWTTLATSGGPPGIRDEQSAIYDTTNNRMTIFAGHQSISTCCPYVISDYNDAWVLSNANGQSGTPTWTQLSPLGSLPGVRSSHSAVYDPANNRMIVFGGSQWNQAAQTSNPLGDLWQLTHANGLGGTPEWSQLSQSGAVPGPRFYHTAAFDGVNQRMIILGGRDQNDVPSNRVWVLALNSTGNCVAPPAGIVAWWPGDGNADDIVGGNNGAPMNGATFAAGLVGPAFALDGLDDHELVPNSPSLATSGEFTIDFWFNPSVSLTPLSSTSPGFLSKGSANSIDLSNNDGRLEVRGPVPRPSSTTSTWLAGTWYHIAVTFDTTNYRIYVNGLLEGSVPSTYSILDNGNDVAIGTIPGFPPSNVSFGGLIDEMSLYNRALTASEVQAIFNAGSAGKCKTPANRLPVANCKNVTVSAGSACTANASIDDGSFDPDGDSITITQSPTGSYPLGATNVTLTVTDSHGASSTCSAIVTVDDSTPPSITGASASPSVLWPPNHKMVDVMVSYNASDNCGSVSCSLSVTSNEPVNGTGDGDTAPDWEIVDAHHVRLRAERAGSGNGRIYTITIACTDSSGNTASESVTVTVPHNR